MRPEPRQAAMLVPVLVPLHPLPGCVRRTASIHAVKLVATSGSPFSTAIAWAFFCTWPVGRSRAVYQPNAQVPTVIQVKTLSLAPFADERTFFDLYHAQLAHFLGT